MAVNAKNLVGIEFDGRCVKMVKVNRDGKITNFAYEEIPEGVLVSGKVESKQILTETVKLARKKLGTSFNKCALSINCTDVVIRHLVIPLMPVENILRSISLELSGFLPTATDRYSIDYVNRGEIIVDGVRKYSLTVFVVPKDIIDSYTSCVKNAGFKIEFLDVMENAIEKFGKMLFTKQGNFSSEFTHLQIDYHKTCANIYSKSILNMNKNIGNGAYKVCADIAEHMSKPIELAYNAIYLEDILISEKTYPNESRILKKYLDETATECSRLLDYYRNRNKESDISVIYLSGAFSMIKGIDTFFEERLGTKVRLFSDFTDVFFVAKKDNALTMDFTGTYSITLREEGK